MTLQIRKSDGTITSVTRWFELAPPKQGAKHWVDGRSAKELAKSFVSTGAAVVPRALQDVLNSNVYIGAVEITELWPEHKIPLDSFRGETRNADLAGLGVAPLGTIALTVEAKADEAFGDTISSALASASERSNIPNRIAALVRGMTVRPARELESLRYQLLHGAAASLILAAEHKAKAAVFLVFEFCGPSCSEDKLRRNTDDLNAFVKMLDPAAASVQSGLIGPLSVPGGGMIPSGIPLFIGKAVSFI